MTAQDQSTLRIIILQLTRAAATSSAGRLLVDLGHEVTPAPLADDAIRHLETERTDLVVIDADQLFDALDVLDRIGRLDPDLHPRVVAVLTDRGDTALAGLTRKVLSSRLRVFLKPLHLHGLLNVVRKLERQEMVDA